EQPHVPHDRPSRGPPHASFVTIAPRDRARAPFVPVGRGRSVDRVATPDRYGCSPMSPDRELYRWQLDALVSWLRCGRRGVIESVTGSGKTDVAIAAAADALRRGRFVLVVVPSRVLMEQWHGRLIQALPGAVIGRL